jgi:hypothetical protein
MNDIRIEVSDIIDATAADVYAVVADYHKGHPAILPKPYFTGLVVEEGGQGAGSILRTSMNIFGQEFHYHQVVSEPEPGRVLVEKDMNTSQWSSFTFDPLGKQTRVTITASFPASPGFKGVMERLLNPIMTRRIFKQELRNLNEYLHSANR